MRMFCELTTEILRCDPVCLFMETFLSGKCMRLKQYHRIYTPALRQIERLDAFYKI